MSRTSWIISEIIQEKDNVILNFPVLININQFAKLLKILRNTIERQYSFSVKTISFLSLVNLQYMSRLGKSKKKKKKSASSKFMVIATTAPHLYFDLNYR